MSRLRVAILLLSSSILVCIGLVARQTIQQAVQVPTVAGLLQNTLVALDGNTAVSDITLSGTARRIVGSTDETGTVTYRALAAGAVRYDFSYPSGTSSEIHAVASAGPLGSWSGPDGVSHPIALHNLANRSDIFPAFTLGPLGSTPNLVATVTGGETKNGYPVFHLSASQQFPQQPATAAARAQHLTQTDVFFDASTLLPVALDFSAHPDDNSSLDIPVEILFSDYRNVSGTQLPFHVQKFFNNVLLLDIQFQNATINTGLSASLFSVQQ
jgi:hypothetical protein